MICQMVGAALAEFLRVSPLAEVLQPTATVSGSGQICPDRDSNGPRNVISSFPLTAIDRPVICQIPRVTSLCGPDLIRVSVESLPVRACAARLLFFRAGWTSS